MFSINNLIIVFLTLNCQTQETLVKKIENSEIISLINSLESDKKYETDKFSVVVFRKSNPSGSAKTKETHEISHSYLIGISEYDEYPTQSAFEVGNYMNPAIIDVTNNNTYIELTIEFGYIKNRKRSIILIKKHLIIIK